MLDSARVTPQPAQAANYRFLHPELAPALNDLLR
jgi:NAD dependent epimerase/dehydratase family enzyme